MNTALAQVQTSAPSSQAPPEPAQAQESTPREEVNTRYTLALYVAGAAPNSVRAISNIKKICEEHLPGRYTLQVIDLYQQPQLAHDEAIIAVPTLIRKSPSPMRRVIGNLSSVERVLALLDLR